MIKDTTTRQEKSEMPSDAIESFREFLNEVPPRSLSGEVLSILQYLENDVLDNWGVAFPAKEPPFLCNAFDAKEFVFRHEYDFGALWDVDEIEEAAADFGQLIQKFIEWRETHPVRSNSVKDLLKDFFNAFVEHLCFHDLRYVPMQELKQFILGTEYVDEKFDAIVDRDGPLLLQLMYQDRASGKGALRSVPMAESELSDLIRSFMTDGHCEKEIEAIQKERRRVAGAPLEDKTSDEVITHFQSFLGYAHFDGIINEGTFISFVSNVGPEDAEDLSNAITQRDARALFNMYRTFMDWPAREPSPKVLAALETALSDFHAFLDPDSFEELQSIPTKQTQHDSEPIKVIAKSSLSSSNSWSSYSYHEAELQRYRSGHPELHDADPPIFRNIDFYRGAIPHPEYHCFIDDFHPVGKYRESSAANTEKSMWFGNYEKLEREHSFIQHLFPIQEGAGLSCTSQRLQKHEAATMAADPAIRERIVRSFETMLDFFGLQLIRPATIRRHPDYIECFDNLDYSSHNFLRITRILKCLGDLQFVELQHSLIDRFILECFEWQDIPAAERDEMADNGDCFLPHLRGSLSTYWVGTVRSDACRKDFEERINAGKKKLAAPST